MKKKQVPSLVKDQRLIKMRREQIVKAAVRLFHEKGYHGTTTREVAKASGFSIGTSYEYIGSKEDILYLVCDAVYEEVMEKWKQLMDKNLQGLPRLLQIIDAYFHVIDEMQDEVLVMYQETKSLPKDALKYVFEKELRMKKVFENEFYECRKQGLIDLNDEEISLASHNILVAGHMWTFRRWAIQKDLDFDTYRKMQISMLLQGFRLHNIKDFQNVLSHTQS